MKSVAVKNDSATKPSSQASKQQARIQPKLMVNAPGDRYEQEADAMAERVMRMPERTSDVPTSTGMIGRSVQRKADGSGGFQAPAGVASQLNSSRGGGSPLPMGTRNLMENAFQSNFSRVRIHADSQAASMNQEINAKAFTYGSDIYFKAGQYSPQTAIGGKLLAHELTHVMQQGYSTASFQHGHIQRTEDDSTAVVDETVVNLDTLSIAQLKAHLLAARENYFVDEEKRIGAELSDRISYLLLSENINELSYREVLQKIFELEYFLEIFPDSDETFNDVLPQDSRDFLKAKLERLRLEMKKPVNIKDQVYINLEGYSLSYLIYQLREMQEWQSIVRQSTTNSIYPDPVLPQVAALYVSELNRRIDTDYNLSISEEQLIDFDRDELIGHIMHTRRALTEFTSAADPLYIQLRASLTLLELESNRRGVDASPVPGTFLFQHFPPYGGPPPMFAHLTEDITVIPLAPDEARHMLEEMITTHGLSATRGWVDLIASDIKEHPSEKRDPYAPVQTNSLRYDIAPPNPEANNPYTGAINDDSLTDYSAPVSDEMRTQAETAFTVYNQQLLLLEEENQTFLNEFSVLADKLMIETLNRSEDEVGMELLRYGLSEGVDPVFLSKYPSTGRDFIISDAKNEYTDDLTVSAKKLIEKQEQLERIKGERNAVKADQYLNRRANPFDEINKAVTDWEITPVQNYDSKVNDVEMEFSLLRAEMEQKHPILATYEKGDGYDLSVLQKIAGGSGVKVVAEKLWETMENIKKVIAAYNDDDLIVWETDTIMELTKAQMGVVPYSMRDKVVNDKIEDEKPGPWKAIAIGVLLVGLAILAAPFTSGGSLTLLSGIAFATELGLSAYLINDAINTYNLRKAETGTHFVKAKALSQHEPSFFWLAVEVVGNAIPFLSAAKVFGKMVAASKALRGATTLDEIAVSSRTIREAAEEAGLSERVIQKVKADAVSQNTDNVINNAVRDTTDQTPGNVVDRANRPVSDVADDAVADVLDQTGSNAANQVGAIAAVGAETASQVPMLVRIVEGADQAIARANARVELAIRTNDIPYLNNLMRSLTGETKTVPYLLARDAGGTLKPVHRFYGMAVERQTLREIAADSLLSQRVLKGETLTRVLKNNKIKRGFTDLILEFENTRVYIDVTTPGAVAAHAERFYGENLLQLTYIYPF